MSFLKAASLAATLMMATSAAYAEDPVVQPVQSFYDTLLSTMKQGKQLGFKGRFEKLKPVIEQSFDMPGMTRLSVGPAWNMMTPVDRQALTASLSRYTIASYASNFNGYDGEKFVVEPNSTDRGADKMVASKLVTKSETIPFNYKMRQVGSSWKVIDIYLNGYVSQIAKQRSDFSATVNSPADQAQASAAANALEKKINALSDKLMKE